jgi:hypothetical protein
MNLLLIDSSIREFSLFTNSINPNTLFISYDYTTDTISDILLRIQSLNQTSFTYLGIVFEDDTTFNKLFAINEPYLSFNEQNQIIPNNVTSFIKTLVNTYSITTIDFLACNLLSYPLWHSYFDYLIIENNVIVRASNNLTGNLSIGGDWVLETTNENIRDLYFTEEIGNWNSLLGMTNNNNSNIILDKEGNMYYVGINTRGCFGTSSTAVGAVAQTFTLNTDFPSLPSRKVLQVCCSSLNNLGFSWLITNEPTNNLYTCGLNITGMLGINSSDFIERNFFSNKLEDELTDIFPSTRFNSISLRNYNSIRYGVLVSDEPANNLYIIGNYFSDINNPTSTSNFTDYLTPTKIIDINSSAINGKKIIKACVAGQSWTILALTNETTNNFYIHGYQDAGNLGLATFSTIVGWTNGSTVNPPNNLSGKKVLNFYPGNYTNFILTNETTNNLYVASRIISNNNPPLNLNGTGANQTKFINTAFTDNPFSSIKVLGVSTGLYATLVWTNEPVNNLYFCGSNFSFNVGGGLTSPATIGFSKSFTNTPFLNKRVKYAKIGEFSYVLTDEETNNFYSVGQIAPNSGTSNYGLITGRANQLIIATDTTALANLQSFGNTFVN